MPKSVWFLAKEQAGPVPCGLAGTKVATSVRCTKITVLERISTVLIQIMKGGSGALLGLNRGFAR